MKTLDIEVDAFHSEWNYTIRPRSAVQSKQFIWRMMVRRLYRCNRPGRRAQSVTTIVTTCGAQWHGGDNRRVNLNQKLSTGVIQRPSPQTIELLQEDWRAIEAVLRTSS